MTKLVKSFRRLADSSSHSSLDDQSKMRFEAMCKSFKSFITATRGGYGQEFLNRAPTSHESRSIEQGYVARNEVVCDFKL